MGSRLTFVIPLAGALLAGCSRAPVHVAGPFYLDTLPDTSDVYLFRCPSGPGEGGVGCAVDGLPGPHVVRAGGNAHYVVVVEAVDLGDGPSRYFYFARVPQETRGWGKNPEKIMGPLTKAEFDQEQRGLGLPAPETKP